MTFYCALDIVCIKEPYHWGSVLFPQGAAKVTRRPLIGVDHRHLAGAGRGIQGLAAAFLAFVPSLFPKSVRLVCPPQGPRGQTVAWELRRSRRCRTLVFPCSPGPAPAPPSAGILQGQLAGQAGLPGSDMCQPTWPFYTEFSLRAFHSGMIISALSSRRNSLLTVESLLTCAVQNGVSSRMWQLSA